MCKKLTIEDCRRIAAERGGECLSEEYDKNNIKLKWRCKHGHEWEATLHSIKQLNNWCPTCYKLNKIKYTLDDCIKHAKSKGGECLSDTYISKDENIIWKCNCGHEWQACFNNIKYNNSWCPECAKEKRAKTNTEKYGSISPFGNKEIKNKSKKTCLERYGVEYPSQYLKFALKIAKKTNNPSIKYHWKTNEEVNCQGGYEPKVVDYLNKNQINYIWQPEKFTLANDSTYLPDLLLTDSNTYIEIKGRWYDDAIVKWTEFSSSYPNSELWDKKKLKELGIL